MRKQIHGILSKYQLVVNNDELVCIDHLMEFRSHAFIVDVPEFIGYMADGTTYQEAIANAEGVIGEWVKMAMDMGSPYSSHVGLCSIHADILVYI